MASVSTHVLDAAAGSPASGIDVTLELDCGGGQWEPIGHDVTDSDGRVADLVAQDAVLLRGIYRLTFDTGTFFERGSGGGAFFPFVCVAFEVRDPEDRHHVPLLLSRFSYTTYRGS